MYIREAMPDDNEELQRLQALCPQGTSLIVSTVNSPDFFAGVKAYESYKRCMRPVKEIGSFAFAKRSILC